MRILHVATLVTPDGAYGGPIRVAENQLRELSSRGHEVELIAGHRGFDTVPTEVGGVLASLFPVSRIVPKTGFAGLTSRRLQAHLRRRFAEADVVHVHLARDLITLPAARAAVRAGVPLVVQTHGMIDESANPLAGPLDALMTRSVLANARVLTLTGEEEQSLVSVARRPLDITRIPNGVPTQGLPASSDDSREVLFLARLHARKRPAVFVEMAQRLLAEGVDASFVLVGPDEGEGRAVREAILAAGLGDRVRWEGPLAPSQTLERLARCAVYVLPSVNEIVPMSVLEAMSLGRPVVITQSNGLAEPLREAEAALVVDESVEQLTDAVRSLLADVALRRRLGRNGRALTDTTYGIPAVGAQLESIYEGLARRDVLPAKQTN
ncbi:glycosyltransferase [Compostimonas suwonensis]|uniref:Glycosyltransferase involved in cell wall biosynthesis n=1 Tax=Compostimonas suwonensis TaxID=1048394 RepID=A0A2M9BC64_9MICO|nr:glycosyltransferase [Compostimonas suwonensis]PJJ55555.1 glycosyltransferase involved in cell wall biosynthesis [Compostimonas suwonensis]